MGALPAPFDHKRSICKLLYGVAIGVLAGVSVVIFTIGRCLGDWKLYTLDVGRDTKLDMLVLVSEQQLGLDTIFSNSRNMLYST